MASKTTAKVKSKKTQPITTKDGRLVARLVKLWRSHEVGGLEVRLKMGAELNKQLGAPTGRQPHGQAVLKEAGKRLGIGESDLSRMRWFAHHFKEGLADFRRRHRDADSWAKVKELLPTLNATKATKPAPSAGRVTVSRCAVVFKALEAACSRVRTMTSKPTEVDREKFRTLLKKLLDAAKVRFRLGVSIG